MHSPQAIELDDRTVNGLADAVRDHSAATYLEKIFAAGSMSGMPHESVRLYLDKAVADLAGTSTPSFELRCLMEQFVINHHTSMLMKARGVDAANVDHCTDYIRLSTQLDSENRQILKLIASLQLKQQASNSTSQPSSKKRPRNKLVSNAA
ncbi:hypothetical protein [Aureliella helgolandensis]|uniref:Uncharacterized protein n=1 Tax=Aureliella helgolandensis TaxID=2527968 RepID=A0A518G9Q1_9BACT|nr:hypothetical protein [Aureliella helgolandensis]QDV25327.1 hypothetical protein Q31a_36510 [Aureliella helgolandensis]